MIKSSAKKSALSKVIALVVTHNRLNRLKITLGLISEQDISQLIIINCGSYDGTREWLNEKRQSNWHIKHIENIGGAGGFAYGCQFANSYCRFDWLLLFDDDACPDKQLIRKFTASHHYGASLVGCKVTDSNHNLPTMNRLVHHLPNTICETIHYLFNRESFLASPAKKSDVIIGSFIGLFIHQRCLHATIDQIKPDLFLYYDDCFYTRYCTMNGYKYIYNPELQFMHDTTQDFADFPPWRLYLLGRNQFIQKHSSSKTTVFYIFVLIRICRLMIKGFCSKKRWASINAVLLGSYDGFMNNFAITCGTNIIHNINQRIGLER